MKLLFDANLSPRLVGRLAELFPGSLHVFEIGMASFTSDNTIWEYAKVNDFTIVTADSDFLTLLILLVHHPGLSTLNTVITEPTALKN